MAINVRPSQIQFLIAHMYIIGSFLAKDSVGTFILWGLGVCCFIGAAVVAYYEEKHER